MSFRPAAIMAALDAQEMTWAVVVFVLGAMVTVAVTAWRLGSADKAADKKRVEDLGGQLAAERHSTVMNGLGDIKTDVHALRGEVSDLRREQDALKPRVHRIEKHLFREDQE